MIKFRKKVDKANKIYIPKVMQETFQGTLTLHPNSVVAALYPDDANLSRVIESLKLIIRDLELQTLGKQGLMLG